jgi:hypothetical protein
VYNDTVYGCPKRKLALESLKTSEFYDNPILSKIIDGAYWNGEMYGYMPNGKWIYLKKEKITVYPPEPVRWTLKEKYQADNLYHGLLRIKQVLDRTIIGDCHRCKFSVDHFNLAGVAYEVCMHPSR